jgi:hypothetical protein
MDAVTLDLAIFLLATFTAALVAGLAGFAFGLVAAAAAARAPRCRPRA